MVSVEAKRLAERLWSEANARDYTGGDLLAGDPKDLAAQLTPEARAYLEAEIDGIGCDVEDQ